MISISDSVKERFVISFPRKVKLIIHPKSQMASTWLHEELVDVSASFRGDDFLTSMLEIFTRRWKTMDLISVMKELKRSLAEKRMANRGSSLYFTREKVTVISTIKENLSCLLRFSMHEESTN